MLTISCKAKLSVFLLTLLICTVYVKFCFQTYVMSIFHSYQMYVLFITGNCQRCVYVGLVYCMTLYLEMPHEDTVLLCKGHLWDDLQSLAGSLYVSSLQRGFFREQKELFCNIHVSAVSQWRLYCAGKFIVKR